MLIATDINVAYRAGLVRGFSLVVPRCLSPFWFSMHGEPGARGKVILRGIDYVGCNSGERVGDRVDRCVESRKKRLKCREKKKIVMSDGWLEM